ncbi:hypothetical protein ACIHAA_05350 [Streptomyces sp. NPDC052040]|uniref:hypothetical protein n=1 Tax=Streptomyces sp. NPDC052040 TaxID=3365682 RepID=UPI0037D42794
MTRSSAAHLGRRLVAGVAVGGLSVVVGAPAANAATAPDTARAAGVRPAASQSTVDLGSWMEQMQGTIGDRPLNRIVMPGSHDAGTAGITKDSGICDLGDTASTAKKNRSVAASMSKSQSGSLIEQLDGGSRYLDLRLCEQGGTWYLYHGGPMGRQFFDSWDASGHRVKGEVSELGDWIHQHKKEIVIIRLQAVAPSATAREDIRAAISELGGVIDGSRLDNPEIADGSLSPTSTYNQFMAAGKHIVVIDDTNSTSYPWAWGPGSQSFRGSYVEVSHDAWDVAKSWLDPDQAQKNRDAVINRAGQVFAKAPGGDADKFFVLEGIVDPTNSIPDAAITWFLAQLKLLPAAVADTMLLNLEHKLNKQLLDRFRGDWNTSNVSDNMNIIMTDDVNQNSDGVGAGELQREIISKNLPTVPVTPHTFYGTSRRSDGSWTGQTALSGAGDAFRFQGSRESVAAMPDGSAQVVGIGNDGNIWHTIRRADGSWQGWNILPAADNRNPGFAATDTAITGMPDGDAQIVAVGKDGYAYHTIRRADGSWQGWAAMAGTDNGLVKASRVALAGMPDGSTQVLLFGADGRMRLGTRAANGSWTPWSVVKGVNAADFQGHGPAIAALPDGDSQIAAIGNDGNIWVTTHRADGSWADWFTPRGVSTQAMGATAVALTGMPDGTSQILAVGLDGNVYHSVRGSDGFAPFRPLGGLRGAAAFPGDQVSIAGMPDGSAQVLLTSR